MTATHEHRCRPAFSDKKCASVGSVLNDIEGHTCLAVTSHEMRWPTRRRVEAAATRRTEQFDIYSEDVGSDPLVDESV